MTEGPTALDAEPQLPAPTGKGLATTVSGAGSLKASPERVPVPVAAGEVTEKAHVRWRFWVLTGALGICLIGGLSPWTPSDSRPASFAIAGTIVAAMAKPLEGMNP